MSELSLSKIQRILPIDPPSVSARLTAEQNRKIFLTFFNCAPPKFFSIKETKIFLFCLPACPVVSFALLLGLTQELRKRFPTPDGAGGQKFLPPDPLPFCPPALPASRASRRFFIIISNQSSFQKSYP